MKKATVKLLTGITGLAVSLAVVGGGTMAWFTDSKSVQDTSFKAGTVKISANQTVVANPGDTGKQYYDIDLPDSVVSYNPVNVKKSRQNSDILTPPKATDHYGETNTSDSEICSLGLGGSIVLHLSTPLKNGDILVIEGTWGTASQSNGESAVVSASSDGTTFEQIGTVKNTTDPKGNFHSCTVSCNGDGFNYVKLVDNTRDVFPNSSSDDGFDISYLCGRNIVDETNWNPGDTNKIAYEVDNEGTKDVQVRMKLDVKWADPNDGNSNCDALTNSVPSMVTITPDSSWVLRGDGYYYYVNSKSPGLRGTAGGESDAAKKWVTGSAVQLNASLSTQAGNQYQGKKLVITPTFEAIQYTHSSQAETNGWTWDAFDTYK